MATNPYSATPLFKKLGYKNGDSVRLINPPDEYFDLLIDKPDDIHFTDDHKPLKDLIHFFTMDLKEFNYIMPSLLIEIKQTGMIWVSWPKKASGMVTDLSSNHIRICCLQLGLVDSKVCSINPIWSGLKFVIPIKDRKKMSKP